VAYVPVLVAYNPLRYYFVKRIFCGIPTPPFPSSAVDQSRILAEECSILMLPLLRYKKVILLMALRFKKVMALHYKKVLLLTAAFAVLASLTISFNQVVLGPSELHSNRRGLKTLVIVTGSLRGGEMAWTSLYENLLDVNEADLAVITEDHVPDQYQNASLFKRAKYLWKVPKYDDWADAMDLVHNSSAWRGPVFSMYRGGENIMLGGLNDVRASGAIVFMFRWFLSQRLQELKLTEVYDRFVVTRSDQYYLCPHDLWTLNINYLWVPEGEDYDGICDRHFVCSRDHILQALNTLPPLLLHPQKYRKQLTRKRYNSEAFLKHRWAEDGLLPMVQRFRRSMFTSATPQDSTRWRIASSDPVVEGVYIKYPKEYIASLKTCQLS
jgi:hypothetical protein